MITSATSLVDIPLPLTKQLVLFELAILYLSQYNQ